MHVCVWTVRAQIHVCGMGILSYLSEDPKNNALLDLPAVKNRINGILRTSCPISGMIEEVSEDGGADDFVMRSLAKVKAGMYASMLRNAWVGFQVWLASWLILTHVICDTNPHMYNRGCYMKGS